MKSLLYPTPLQGIHESQSYDSSRCSAEFYPISSRMLPAANALHVLNSSQLGVEGGKKPANLG